MTVVNYVCPCGFRSSNLDNIRKHVADRVPVDPGSCCNCGGRRCMACVLREIHDVCVDDCPDCCEGAVNPDG